LCRVANFRLEELILDVCTFLNDVERIKLRLTLSLFLVEENVVDALKGTFRHVWHRRFKNRKVWIKVGPRREVGPNDNTQLPSSGVANNITIAERKVVTVLLLSICCVKELKDSVTLDIYRLDKDQLVVGPLNGIRMSGPICRNVGAGAVLYLTEQHISTIRRRIDATVLPVRSLW
jgi:hypothetical protein